MSVEIVTKEEFQKSLDDLEGRFKTEIQASEQRLRTDLTNAMRKILTEDLPVILEKKFVTKQALAEAAK